MTDIHTHILPGIDDGAEDEEQAIEMLVQAYESGTDVIIFTPHCNIPGLYQNYWNEELEDHFQDLKKHAERVLPIRIYRGMEVYATRDLPMLIDDNKVITINDSQYMLLEFDFNENPDWAEQMINKVKGRNLVPIIAHPERYSFIQACPQILYDWVCNGALAQVNKDSLLGKFGSECSRTARTILSCNLAHFVASDAHSPISRTTRLWEAYRLICDYYSEEYAALLFDINPTNMVKDNPVLVPDPIFPPM